MPLCEHAPGFAARLAECCVDGSADWTIEQLDSAVVWFKQNRTQIMENIPSIAKGKRKVRRPILTVFVIVTSRDIVRVRMHGMGAAGTE